jgi:hypothetical protein
VSFSVLRFSIATELVGDVEACADAGELRFRSCHAATNQLDGELIEPSAGSIRVAADERLDYIRGSLPSVAPTPAVLVPMMRRRSRRAPTAAVDLAALPEHSTRLPAGGAGEL